MSSGGNTVAMKLRAWLRQVDWPLLAFLSGATHVKLYVKIAAIVFYTAWLIYRKAKWYRLPGPGWFYLAMPILGMAVAAAYGSFSVSGYDYAAAIGTLQWVTGGAILYLLFITAKRQTSQSLATTAQGYFALNAIVTAAQYIGLIIASKHLMPYWFYDSGLKYGASTGDRLTGLCLNNSLNNAAVCLMGVIFFLTRGLTGWAALCAVILLMCTSNVVTFGMILLLLLLLVFSRSKQVRLNVLKLLALTIILYPTLSPQNFKYIETVIGQLTAPSKPFIAEEKLGKDKDSKKGVNAEQPQRYSLSIHIKDDVFRRLPRELVDLREFSLHMPKPAWSYLTIEPAALRQVFPRWYGVAPEGTLLAHYGKPAKLFAVRQTIGFLNTSPRFWLAGAGMGNFSSKLAIKMTGLRWQGSVPDNKIYIARPFAEYHFYTLTYVFSRDVKEHSVINMPSSTYLQFAGEYGLIGIALWAFFYFGWFWMQSKDFKAGRWLLLACLGLFWLDYWYEMMTLTVIMEFLLLSGIFARKPSDAR